MIHVYFGDEEVQGSPISLYVNDPQKAWLSGPEEGFVGEMVAYKGIETFCSFVMIIMPLIHSSGENVISLISIENLKLIKFDKKHGQIEKKNK